MAQLLGMDLFETHTSGAGSSTGPCVEAPETPTGVGAVGKVGTVDAVGSAPAGPPPPPIVQGGHSPICPGRDALADRSFPQVARNV